MPNVFTLETNRYAIKLENFEGPLDLLCHLIDKNKMDIYDIKLNEITDQYIAYINQMEKMNLEITSEFLVMASTLLYLKSKSLLPTEVEDEKELSGISTLRNRVHCEACGSTMMRKVNSQRRIRESWVCSNPECGCRVRISDADLLRKVTILLNRIIENSELIIPSAKVRHRDSPAVAALKGKIEEELNRENPSEEYVVALIGDIANTLYKETQANKKIADRKSVV